MNTAYAYAASALSGPLLLVLAAFACLLLPLYIRALRGTQGVMALSAVLVAVAFLRRSPAEEIYLFNGALVLGPATAYLWAFAFGVLALVTLLSLSAPPDSEETRGEYYFLLIMATLGLMTLVAAGDIFTAFIALELLSLPLYALAGIRRSKPGLEAAYKYFMLGAFGSGLIVMGIALLNAFYPSLAFSELMKAGAPERAALAGFLLVISGFAFKTALAPFHMWVPDVYEGAPTQISAFMGAAVKAGGVIVLWRLFSIFDGGPVREIFWWLAMITAVAANLMALGQTGLKRLLAYSSVAHAGYLAVAFFGGRRGFEAVLYYLPVYAMATIGAFSVALVLEKDDKGPLIGDLAGLAKTRPWLAAAMAAFMFSLAGVPPLAGFFAKFYAFAGAVNSGYTGLVVIAVIMSAVSMYYYLKVTVVMCMTPPPVCPPKAGFADEAASSACPGGGAQPAAGEQSAEPPGAVGFVIALMAAGVILAGVFSRPLLALAREASRWF